MPAHYLGPGASARQNSRVPPHGAPRARPGFLAGESHRLTPPCELLPYAPGSGQGITYWPDGPESENIWCNRTVRSGYSTTHLLYGQHPYCTLARWQGAEGFHEQRKCNGLQIIPGVTSDE